MLGLELVMAGHLLWHASASATQAATCPVQKNARVDVKWHSEPIKYDNNRNTNSLNHTDIDTENPYGTHVVTDVNGVMSGKITFDSNVLTSSVRFPAEAVTCLWIDKVVVTIVVDPTIAIAAEYPEGTCKHSAILEHEHKHIAADLALVKDHLQAVRQAASQAVQKVGMVGPKPIASAQEYKDKMTNYVLNAVKLQMDELYLDRSKRQKAIDTKEEYDRVEGVCPDKAKATQEAAEAEKAASEPSAITAIPGTR
ncbi:MAG TPA: hypothetical protein VIN59_09100 [Alphaproteobacteria bacterium]